MPVTDGSASSSFRVWISGKSATGAVRARARGSGARASTGLGLEVDENIKIDRPRSAIQSARPNAPALTAGRSYARGRSNFTRFGWRPCPEFV